MNVSPVIFRLRASVFWCMLMHRSCPECSSKTLAKTLKKSRQNDDGTLPDVSQWLYAFIRERLPTWTQALPTLRVYHVSRCFTLILSLVVSLIRNPYLA